MPRRSLLGTLVVCFFLGNATWLAAQPPVPPDLEPGDKYHLVFVTRFDMFVSTNPSIPPFFPVFGSIEAADWNVSTSAGLASLLDDGVFFESPPYTAIMSAFGENARDRINVTAPVYNMQGELLAVDHADLFDGAIENAVRYDEYGVAVPIGTPVWTGSTPTGFVGLETASNWNNPSGFADVANPHMNDQRWLRRNSSRANIGARIYGFSPQLTVPVPEPATFILGISGGLACLRRGRQTS